jgi:hypothetical protein
MEVLPTANFQPDVVLWGLRIGEPMITLTGLLVTGVCFYGWLRLGRAAERDDARTLTRIFLLLTGLSTLVGGLVGHAFLHCLPFVFKLPGWMLGMVAVSALEQAAILRAEGAVGRRARKVLTWLNIAQLTVALWFVSSTLWFPTVEIHSAIGFLLLVAPLEAWRFGRGGDAASVGLLLGVLLLVGAVLAHISKISLSPWFCYFDFAHLFMAAAMWAIMRGGEAMGALTMERPAV